jgi:hypothetical protein
MTTRLAPELGPEKPADLSAAEVGAFVGQRKLSITADTYTHVLVDGREVDYPALLALSA